MTEQHENRGDADRIEDIARKFFQQNYSACSIESTAFQNNTWYVKVAVTLFGQNYSRTLTIDPKTGRIISCE